MKGGQQPLNITEHEHDASTIVAETWEELGRKMRVVNDQVLLRTAAPRKVTEGGILLPDNVADFYQGLPNVEVPGRTTAVRSAVVLAVGRDVHVLKEGDRVIFPRGHFASYKKLDDGSYAGWIREEHIWATVDD